MITKHALRYSINLDGFVSKANAIPLLRGGFSTVWLGTLQLQEAKTVVNALENNGFLGVGKTGKVNPLFSLNTLPHREPRLL